MNWPLFIEVGLGLFSMALGGAWWLSALNARFAAHVANDNEKHAELGHQINRLRDWRHEKVSPILQTFLFDYEQRNGDRVVSYADLDDSRVTNDPKKEPTK